MTDLQERSRSTSGATVADAVEATSLLDLLSALDDPDADPSCDDAYSAEDLVMHQMGGDDSDTRIRRDQDIPIGVVADLVNGWRELGKRGDWTLSAVHWCARRTGQGNRSWWIATLDPEEDFFRVWRLSKGGQGKVKPTVKEVDGYRRKFEVVRATSSSST